MKTVQTACSAHLQRGQNPAQQLKPLARGLALASLLTLGHGLSAQTASAPLPKGLTVVNGQATVSTQGAAMTVRNSRNAILNWESFNVNAGHSVQFVQPDSASKVLNRVTGHDPSNIFGQISSNGQVWLLNPNGVLFGQGARVDVAGLVTSTLRLNDSDWLQGQARFSAGLPGASIVNQGELRSSLGGRVALLAETVRNEGQIDAPGGAVHLAAGRSIDLVDTATPNVAVRVTAPVGEVVNLGQITSAAGVVDVQAAMVNQQGIVRADALSRGPGGEVRLLATQGLTLGAQSHTSASGSQGGTLSLQAGSGTLLAQGQVSATGQEGQGGQLDVLGAQVGVLDGASLDVSGSAGGGQVRVGGGLRGQDSTVPNAQAVFVGAEASIKADATQAGQGGRIIVWSDQATRAYGSFSARGAGGAGGYIETSGGWLDAQPKHLSVAGAPGQAGQWLLDPNNLLITDFGADSQVSAGPNFSTTNDNAVISTATIASALNAGNNVTIATASGGANSQAGDITMQNATLAVNPASPVSLTLQADRDIYINNTSVSSSTQPLTINLQSAMGTNSQANGGSVAIFSSSFNTAGGDFNVGGPLRQACGPTACASGLGFTMGHAATPGDSWYATHGIYLYDVAINAGAGAVSLKGAALGQDAGAGVFVERSTMEAKDIRIDGFNDTLTDPSTGFYYSVILPSNTSLRAYRDLAVSGSGDNGGVIVYGGASLSVDTTGHTEPGTLSLTGSSRNGVGGGLILGDWFTSSGGATSLKGTGNVDISLFASSPQQRSFEIGGDGLRSSPIIDASAAKSLTIQGVGRSAYIYDVEVAAPSGGALLVSIEGDLAVDRTRFTGAPAAATFAANRGSNGELSDLSLTNTTLAFSPASPATLTLEADRNITISGSTVSSTAQPLTVNLKSAMGPDPLINGGSVLINSSSFTTAGGDFTVGGGSPQLCGSLSCSVDTGYAIGHPAAFGETSLADYSPIGFRQGVEQGIALDSVSINAASGAVRLKGAAVGDPGDLIFYPWAGGVFVRRSTISAQDILINGYSTVPTYLFSRAVQVRLDSSLTATRNLSITGHGETRGVSIGEGALLWVDASGRASPGQLSILGVADVEDPGTGSLGVSLWSGDGSRPTLRATNAAIDIQAVSESTGGAIQIYGILGSAAPIIDAADATALTINGVGGSTAFVDTAVAVPVGGPLAISGGSRLGVYNTTFTGAPSSATLVSNGNLQISDAKFDFSSAPGSLSILGKGLVAPSTGDVDGSVHISNSTVQVNGDVSIAGTKLFSDANEAVKLTDTTVTSTGTVSVTAKAGSPDVPFTRAGASALGLYGSTVLANTIVLQGQSDTGGSGVIALAGSGGQGNALSGADIRIEGYSKNLPGQTPDKAGIDLQSTTVSVSNGGSLSLTGDWVRFGGFPDGVQSGSIISGAASRFSVDATQSIYINGLVDFRAGAGTNVTLTSDTDSDLSGRVRLNGDFYTGGGDFKVTGGTGYAAGVDVGVYNYSVREGSSGVLLEGGLIDAGVGSVSLAGSAVRRRGDSEGSGWGIQISGEQLIKARAVSLNGVGADRGYGIFAASPSPDRPFTALNIEANSVSVQARQADGVGDDGTIPEALFLGGGGQWNVTGSVALNANGDAVLPGLKVNSSAGSITMASTGLLSIDKGQFTAASGWVGLTAANTTLQSVDVTAASASVGATSGNLNVADSKITTKGGAGSGTVDLYAAEVNITNADITGGLVSLRASSGGLDLDDSRIKAQVLELEALNTSGEGISFNGAGLLQASQFMRLSGTSGEANREGIKAERFWQFNAPEIWFQSDQAMRFTQSPVDPVTGVQEASPRINATERLIFSRLSGSGTMTVGGADAQLDTSELNLALKDMGADSKVVFGGLYEPSSGDSAWKPLTPSLSIGGQLDLAGRVRFYAPAVTFLAGAQVRAGAAGDAVIVAGSAGYSQDPSSGNAAVIDNQAGVNVFTTPNGRWMLYAESPKSLTNLGGLQPEFEQYGTAFNRYQFTPEGNVPGPLPAGNGVFYASAAPKAQDAPAQVTTAVLTKALASTAGLRPEVSTPAEGRVQDVIYAFSADSTEAGSSFRSLPVSSMTEGQLLALLAARENHKKKVFAEAIHQLELDPSLADVRACANLNEINGGQCLITESLQREIQAARAEAQKARATSKRKVKTAALPQIARKLALVVGVDRYRDKRIPQLENAVNDARAVAQVLESQLGYETVVLENASKESLVRSLNQLARDADGDDSVVIYYAGHGELLASRKTGYWLLSDADAAKPASWISNADIARLVAQVGARQVALISDSCYSGSLTSGEKIVAKGNSKDAASVLQQRAVVVMSSGSNEPVADEGKEGHSIFAWNFMSALKSLSDWQVGGSVFERVRDAVSKEFPQTPQYSAFSSAGHQSGADYLFEKRSLESAQ